MTYLNKSFCFLFVVSVLAGFSPASAENVPRLYTNDVSCGAIKSAIRKSGRIVLRFKKPRSTRITYDLFFKSPSSCASREEAVSVSVPSSGGSCRASYQCVLRMDREDNSSSESVVAAKPVVVAPTPPSDDGCGGCESQDMPK